MSVTRNTSISCETYPIHPQERIYTDELRRLAWGTDAGFYRLIPQVVIRSDNEKEVSELLKCANKHLLPVTFRAAGTSLSGQAISDSILIVAGKHWEKYTVSPDATQITLQPGIIGQRVNELLKPRRNFRRSGFGQECQGRWHRHEQCIGHELRYPCQ